MYQCNNLKLRYDRYRKVYQVLTLDNKILEEFESERNAILWMQDTHDFLTPQGRKRKYGY